MARPLRIDYPGAFHHVMNRGANHQPIFVDTNDRSLFLYVLANTIRQWEIRVHAFSLMNNHYHLLIETPLGNLSQAMRNLDGIYTQRFNLKHGRDGSLMRGRFKSILVQKESYFLELIRYIHLNGVKANIYTDPKHDPHCSHPFYMSPKSAPDWLTMDAALSYFGTDSRAAIDFFDAFILFSRGRQTGETKLGEPPYIFFAQLVI
jgi:putative transposase